MNLISRLNKQLSHFYINATTLKVKHAELFYLLTSLLLSYLSLHLFCTEKSVQRTETLWEQILSCRRDSSHISSDCKKITRTTTVIMWSKQSLLLVSQFTVRSYKTGSTNPSTTIILLSPGRLLMWNMYRKCLVSLTAA